MPEELVPQTLPNFGLLTAAYNEEKYIGETIRSVTAQTHLPNIWIVVSDGSSDRTDEILRLAAERFRFIRLVRREKDCNRLFASKVFALRAGARLLPIETLDFIGHLDADVSLGPDYFADLLSRMQRSPRIGIAGGLILEQFGNRFRQRPGTNLASVPGAVQMFRRECYIQVGDLIPIEVGGEDWYAEVKAKMNGWRVQTFTEPVAYHHRPTGRGSGHLRYAFRQGKMDAAFGSLVAFEVLKILRRVPARPWLIGALVRFVGFCIAHLSSKRMVPSEIVQFLRQEQSTRLRSRVRRTLDSRAG